MRTTDRIGFKLIIKEPDTAERTIVVCPRYEGLKLKWTKASGKVYHNKNIEGNVEFWGVDFVTLHNCALRTKFTLVIFYKGRGEVARCEFRKTDCEWDIDHGICKVDVSVWDKYKKLEDGKDNEYNLVKLPGITKKSLGVKVYPIREVYIHNRNEVYALSDRSFMSTITNNVRSYGSLAELESMGFSCNDHYTMNQSIDYKWQGASLASMVIIPSDIIGLETGTYIPSLTNEGGFTWVINWDNTGTWLLQNLWKDGAAYQGNDFIRIKILITTGDPIFNVYYYKGTANSQAADPGIPYAMAIKDSTTAQQSVYTAVCLTRSINDFTSRVRFDFVKVVDERLAPSMADTTRCRFYIAYSRLVSCLGSMGTGSYQLGGDDVYIGNYRSGKPLSRPQYIKVSTRYDSVNNEYLPPWDSPLWIGILKDEWMDGVSLWLRGGSGWVSDADKRAYTSTEKVNDFYLLGDAIKALVNEIDSSITFDTDETHSQFLFARTNPVSGQTQGGLYVSQKSNILKLDYDYPAWLAPIKWSQIETFLKNALGCYYHIDENNHLHIEHITYYENGGSYYTNDRTLLDVTALIDVANRQPVAGKTNQWTWDKDGNGLYSSANRYEYSWMDTQSEIFDGATIVIPDEYNLFTEDKLEDRQIDWFSSDIDFLTSVPSECSSDGFAVVMEDVTNVGSVISGNPHYGGQNYELSLEYLQPKYLIQGIYAEMVRIGNTNYPNTFMARMRTAEVEFTMPAEDWETNPVTHETHDTWVSPDEIIKTDVGEGLIDSLEVDLHSGKWKATIRYENE